MILISQASEPPLFFEASTFQNNCIVFTTGSLAPVFYPLLSFSLLRGISQTPLSCLAPAGVHCNLEYTVFSSPYHGAFDSDIDGYIIDQILAAALSLLALQQ